MADVYAIEPDAKLTVDQINGAYAWVDWPQREAWRLDAVSARAAVAQCADRRIVALVSTPAARPFFDALGFATEVHGHAAMYLRPQAEAGAANP